MDLKGCAAAIVPGGSGGLGQRIWRALALAGVNVVVNYAVSELISGYSLVTQSEYAVSYSS